MEPNSITVIRCVLHFFAHRGIATMANDGKVRRFLISVAKL